MRGPSCWDLNKKKKEKVKKAEGQPGLKGVEKKHIRSNCRVWSVNRGRGEFKHRDSGPASTRKTRRSVTHPFGCGAGRGEKGNRKN